jgi:hypothetical protein
MLYALCLNEWDRIEREFESRGDPQDLVSLKHVISGVADHIFSLYPSTLDLPEGYLDDFCFGIQLGFPFLGMDEV